MTLIDDYKAEELVLRKSLKIVGLYSLVTSVCLLAMPAFLFQVYDRVLHSRSIETLVAMAVFAFVILAAYGFFDGVRQVLLAKAAVRLETKMAGLILAGELSRQSDSSAQSMRDLGAIRQVVVSPAFSSLFDLPMLPLFLALIYLIHPVLGFVVTVGAFILLGMGIWTERATAHYTTEHMKAAIASHKALEMNMGSQELIRAQGMYREAVNTWGAQHGTQLDCFISATEKTSSFSSATKAIRQVIQIMMIGTGAILVLYGHATGGVIFATSMIGGRALAPVESIVGSWRLLKQTYETRNRLLARLADITLPENRTQLPKPKGRMELERVVYTPRPGVPAIIRGVSAVIEPGDVVAVIGPSGAGKSTLARLLVGYFIPNAGRVALDGQDLHVWDPTARGLHMGYIPQQVSFFEATVRENIARLRQGDPEHFAIDAAKAAGVHEMILKFPQGYDTILSKGGFYPSGGQAQLIALARALYGDPAVLVMDEPNASLDNVGEQTFHGVLNKARKMGITTIVVSQRPSVLRFVNKVMVMQEGLIKDYGPRDQVMKSGNVQAVSAAQPKPGAKPAAAKPAADKPAPKKDAEPPKPKKVDMSDAVASTKAAQEG